MWDDKEKTDESSPEEEEEARHEAGMKEGWARDAPDIDENESTTDEPISDADEHDDTLAETWATDREPGEEETALPEETGSETAQTVAPDSDDRASRREKDTVADAPLDSSEDLRQIEAVADHLRNLPEVRYEVWKELSTEDKAEALQKIENTLAEIQGREAIELRMESLESGVFAYYENGEVVLNGDLLPYADMLCDCLDSILHEGRHAYQHHAVEGSDSVPEERAQAWQNNFENYLDASTYGLERYAQQPIEADAAAYARTVLTQLMPEDAAVAIGP